MSDISNKDIADSLMHELSSHIQPWINNQWPGIAHGSVPLHASNIMLNAFINFAAINCALIVKSIMKASTTDERIGEYLNTDTPADVEKLIKLFEHVLKENLKEDQNEQPSQ